MARWGLDKCGCKITVIGIEPGDIPRAKLDRCPLHKNAGRMLKAATLLLLVIHQQMPDTVTSAKFKQAVDRLCRAAAAARGKK
jgi:hypothetical protein